MASEYLKNSFVEMKLDEDLQTTIESSLTLALDAVILNLANEQLLIPRKRQKFVVKPQPKEESPMPKPKADKKTREEYFKKHHQQTEESKEFTKKLVEERLERQKRIQEREREFRIKTLQEIEEQHKRQEEIEKKMEEDKQKKLQEAMQKTEIRKKQLEGLKEEVNKKVPNSKPLYKQMEDAYKQKVLMPKLEQHKAELAKKRILYQPLNGEELKEHYKKHEELMREQEYRRKKELQQKALEEQVNIVSSNLQSKFTQAILEQEKKSKEEVEKAKEEKLHYINKRLQYSKLVKEMFPPIIEESKKFDADYGKASRKVIQTSKSRDSSSHTSLPKRKKIQPSDYKSDIGAIPKRKWEKNSMMPEPAEKKLPVKVDYLAERRVQRGNGNNEIQPIHIDLEKEIYEDDFDSKKAEKIRAKAEKIDKQAMQRERMIGNMGNDSMKGIEVGDQVNDMIISSIRAKLALLDKFNGK